MSKSATNVRLRLIRMRFIAEIEKTFYAGFYNRQDFFNDRPHFCNTNIN
jgi:hypothetical protein